MMWLCIISALLLLALIISLGWMTKEALQDKENLFAIILGILTLAALIGIIYVGHEAYIYGSSTTETEMVTVTSSYSYSTVTMIPAGKVMIPQVQWHTQMTLKEYSGEFTTSGALGLKPGDKIRIVWYVRNGKRVRYRING